MNQSRRPAKNKAMIILGVIMLAAGTGMCVEGALAIRSGRIIPGSAKSKPMTGPEAVFGGVLVMGLGGWVTRAGYRGRSQL